MKRLFRISVFGSALNNLFICNVLGLWMLGMDLFLSFVSLFGWFVLVSFALGAKG